MKLKGRSICMPVAHEFEDLELMCPLLRLSEEGARIVIGTYQASFSARPYVGKTKPITGPLGYPIPPVPMVEGNFHPGWLYYVHDPAPDLYAGYGYSAIALGHSCNCHDRRSRQFIRRVRRTADGRNA